MNILKLPALTTSRRLLCSSIKFHQQKNSHNTNRQLSQNISRNINSSSFNSIKLSQNEHNNNKPQASADPYAPGIKLPPKNALYKIFIAETLIFSIFGFFDNFIMMLFGDRIDSFFGDYITHPMIAAAFGNWLSDLFGMGTSERFETVLNKAYPAPRLNAEQIHSKPFHNWKYGGRFTGITIGCAIGALVAYPLLENEDKYTKFEEEEVNKADKADKTDDVKNDGNSKQ